jgi:hypothetical protein
MYLESAADEADSVPKRKVLLVISNYTTLSTPIGIRLASPPSSKGWAGIQLGLDQEVLLYLSLSDVEPPCFSLQENLRDPRCADCSKVHTR